MVIDRATILEWPQIEALRSAYFERMGCSLQRRSDATIWFIVHAKEIVLGCYSVEDATAFKQRWILDFYIAALSRPDRIHVAIMMRDHIYCDADRDGLDVLFHVDPRNGAQLRAIFRHGQAEPAGMLFLRKARREAACPQP